MDGAVAGVGILVDLAVADALETARTGQSGPKAADARKHIEVSNQMVWSSFLLQRTQKVEDIVIHASGLRLLLRSCSCDKFHTAKFLPNCGADGLQQSVLFMRPADCPAHGLRPLPGGNRAQQSPCLPLER